MRTPRDFVLPVPQAASTVAGAGRKSARPFCSGQGWDRFRLARSHQADGNLQDRRTLLVAPTDTKVSTDTIVQSIRFHVPVVIAFASCAMGARCTPWLPDGCVYVVMHSTGCRPANYLPMAMSIRSGITFPAPAKMKRLLLDSEPLFIESLSRLAIPELVKNRSRLPS
jgi:hypothetical protein